MDSWAKRLGELPGNPYGIEVRLLDGWKQDKTLAISQAGLTTSSLKNLEWVGMRKAYDKILFYKNCI